MNKKEKKKKIDIEAKLFMALLHLKEEKDKKYSVEECEKNIVYLFNDYDEFKSYFELNGFKEIDKDLLELCRMKTTKKGTVIALKGLCDHAIRTHNLTYSQTVDSAVQEETDYLFRDFPEFKVTKETKKDVIENPQKYSSCDVRIRMGKFYTNEEHQKYIKDGLSRELPGQKQLCKKRKKRK